jgi:hypothetical protein
VEKWCAVAVLFLRNRTSYQLLKSCPDGWKAEDVIDGRRQWPPASLQVSDWFDFEASFDLLFGSQDALCQECACSGVDYPEYPEEKAPEVDKVYLRHVKELQESGKGKKHWQNLVVWHLKDLVHFFVEASWQK